MKKAITFVLAVMLVMSMAVPTFATHTSPTAPVTSETATAAKPEVVEDAANHGDIIIVLVATNEAKKELTKEEQKTFAEAQKTLKEATPDGMKAQYFFFYTAENKDGKRVTPPATLTVKIANVTKVVVKQFVDGKWVELKATLKDGNVVIEGLVEGPVAIFTK